MKKWLLLGIFCLFTLSACNSEPAPECVDSDGLDYYTLGKVKSEGQNFADKCDGATLTEQHCGEQGPTTSTYACEHGCENGACLRACTPTDEVCDGVDNNCDGVVDEGCETKTDTCTDADGDGYGTAGECEHAELDCRDDNSLINPGATESCDGFDNNCNGDVDEGCTSSGELAAFPGAAGFGSDTPHGSGRHLSTPSTTVYKVTNLNDGGSGSLRDCVEASGPRVCIFEVSGNIGLQSELVIDQPYLYIAGQTAPSPGITVKDDDTSIRTHDVLIQDIRFRAGDSPPFWGSRNVESTEYTEYWSSLDSLSVDDIKAKNVVLDHITASWGTDTTAIIIGTSGYITVSNSIISEGLHDNRHQKGTHGKGLQISENEGPVSVFKTVFAHNMNRNPVVSNTETLVANNVVCNWGQEGMPIRKKELRESVGGGTGPIIVSLQGIVFMDGEDTVLSKQKKVATTPMWLDQQHPSGEINNGLFASEKPLVSSIYVDDLMDNGVVAADQWSLFHWEFTDFDVDLLKAETPAVVAPNVDILSSSDVVEHLIANAGARPGDRDSVDTRIINDIANDCTGSVIDFTADVGGWPALEENYRELTVPENPNADDDGDGYTNLENWLHTFYAEVR